MSYVQDILSEYTRMRENGLETKAVLQALRQHIENLDKPQREELARLVRAWETRAARPTPPPAAPTEIKTDSQPRKHPVIKPLVRTVELPPVESPAAPTAPTDSIPEISWVACPNCGRPNQSHEVFCYACGQLLEPIKGSNVTKQLDDPSSVPSSEFFGPESVLALRMRGSSDVFEVRPQTSDHEIIIGRSSSGSAIMPDVDLNTRQAADLGVSRMHMAIRYEADQNAVLVVDLGSANGTFINGQRVLPKEIRVLRHGDELRLGRLVLMVSFRHPGKPA
ncbi:MAG: FHA domain-containing protein [Chloroflexi bacterium]|nr:FHA domain-containing protein [Chloroflexota bacterium]